MRDTSRDTAVDRLIELAREDKGRPPEPIPAGLPTDLSLEDQKDPRSSMWRSLLQLRVLLPYVSRLLPLLDSGFAHAPDTRHFVQSVAEVQATNRELSQQVLDQTVLVKRVEEQLTKLRETIERNALDAQELGQHLRTLQKTVRTLGTVSIGLLVALIGLVAYSIFR